MSSKRDYYEVLSISKTATADEIRKAYKQLALKFHPDRNPGDKSAEAQFKEASEAAKVLLDDDLRARYDRFGHAGLQGDAGGGGGQDIFTHFQDLFSELFGGSGGFGGFGRGRADPRRGADIGVRERLTFKEAVLGCKKDVSFQAPAPCDECQGSGAAKGASPKTCPTCKGGGQVSVARGFIMFTQSCSRCQGRGAIIDTPCKTCRGGGQVQQQRKVAVTFPAGIDNGMRLRVQGQGTPGPKGGAPGDLYVDVEVESDPRFERNESDLVTRLSVSFSQATLGAKLPLALVDDSSLTVDVPAGTQPNSVITLRGQGVAHLDGRGKGALHVVVQVDVPKKLSPKARELLLALESELKQPSSPVASQSVPAE